MARTCERCWLVVVFFTMSVAMTAQPHWAWSLGGTGNDHVADILSDAAGHLYITGEFSGVIVFDGQGFMAGGGTDLFVAKLDPNGGLIWWRQGGGPGIDRGVKLALSAAGELAVVGEFMGQADVLGTPVQSAGGTPDMFIAELDGATGATNWVRHGGGADGADRPYGVGYAPSGQVTLAGEFKGTATWDGVSLVSTLEPLTMVHSMDIVVASYSGQGNLLWLQQGAAEFTDRAIDLATDAAGAIYVCGQFSDTIAFDQVHDNAMYNASFLLKLDPAGNEVWFRRFGGAVYNHVRDMQMAGDGHLLIAGDLRGTMIFLDSVPDMVASVTDHAYYLLEVDTAGQYVRHARSGSDELISARSVVERNDTIAVLGHFECSWTEKAAVHGAGRFLAVGDEDLFIERFTLDSLAPIDAQQFGGSQEKLAGQMTLQPDGALVFSGSFERGLVFPADDSPFPTTAPPIGEGRDLDGNSIQACQDSLMGSYVGLVSVGLKDGFIAKGFVEGRSPYDAWIRNDTVCAFPLLDACIWSNYDCQDSIRVCGTAHLSTRIPVRTTWPGLLTLGPEVDILWPDGGTRPDTVVNTSGWYWVQVSWRNGCIVWTDSIHVIVDPVPPKPLISDDVVVNTAAYHPLDLVLCSPDTALIWVANPVPWADYVWTNTADSSITLGTSVQADTTGWYVVVATTVEGCSSVNHLHVQLWPSDSLPALDATITIDYGADTLWLCPQEQGNLGWTIAWSVNGVPFTPPDWMDLAVRVNGGPWGSNYSFTMGSEQFTPTGNGVHTHVIEWRLTNGPCVPDTLYFSAGDSVVVVIHPAVPLSFAVSGPGIACEGDTVLWTMQCVGCSSVTASWGVSLQGDSAWVSVAGLHVFQATAVDTTTGCSANQTVYKFLVNPGIPELQVLPPDGVICPGDSALISTPVPGTDHIWYGPMGPQPNGLPFVYTSVPGEYYMTMIDTLGCFLASDPVLITGYATPFLNVTPDGVLCASDPNDEVTLQVVTTGYNSLIWDAPLSGNNLVQVVDQPGTYGCSVSACGISTVLSVDVVAGVPEAIVLAPDTVPLCPGTPVVLEAAPGQALYIWEPGTVYGAQLTVTAPGAYVLTVIDASGCTATSDTVWVIEHMFTPATATGDTVCAGSDAVLTVTGSGTFLWYADPGLDSLLGSGPQLVLPALTTTTTVLVQPLDTVCGGVAPIPVTAVVLPVPGGAIDAPVAVCLGQPVLFTFGPTDDGSVLWVTPGGAFQGDSLSIPSVQLSDAGIYSATWMNTCGVAVDTVLLTVLGPASFSLGPDTAICPGEVVEYTLPVWAVDGLWNGQVQGSSFITGAEGAVIASALDMQGCAVADTVIVDLLWPDIPLVVDDVEVCAGAAVVLTAQGSGYLNWFSDGVLLGVGPLLDLGVPVDSLLITVDQVQYGCTTTVQVQVSVTPMPMQASLVGPTTACLGEPFTLELVGGPGITGTWTGPQGSSWSGPVWSVPAASSADSGVYEVLPAIGPCVGDTLMWTLAVVEAQPMDLGPDTTICLGLFVTLTAPPWAASPIWSTGSTATAIIVGAAGVYSLEALDANGCTVWDDMEVFTIECEGEPPTVFSPNGDGINDHWHLIGVGGQQVEVRILDRFGAVVHEGVLGRMGWDGTHFRTGTPVPDGTYFYIVEQRRESGEPIARTGHITLLR